MTIDYKPHTEALAGSLYRYLQANPWLERAAFVSQVSQMLDASFGALVAVAELNAAEEAQKNAAKAVEAAQQELITARAQRDDALRLVPDRLGARVEPMLQAAE